MAIDVETMWVADEDQLQATVQTLVLQGGQVQRREPGAIELLVPKKLSVPVLVGGLVLCLVPGLVYLVWYLAADKDKQVTVRVGTPPNVRTEPRQHWPDGKDRQDEPAPTPPPEVAPTDRRNWGATPEPPAYPADPDKYPIVESPPPPPPPG